MTSPYKTWLTADLHLGHKRIIEFCKRPFSSVEEMDEMLVKNWNDRVKHDDSVYILGDVSFHRPQKTLSLLKRLNGMLHLVTGNHDWKGLMRSDECRGEFEWTKDVHRLVVQDKDAQRGSQEITLCHFPWLTWNKSHHGTWMLHGHSHGSLPDDSRALRIDVGVDCHNYAPVSYTEIKRLMAKKTFKPIDHHGAD